MYVVSGCPRSGTSLMMDILREVFGEERILGKKFPQEEQIVEAEKQHDGETDDHYAARMYIYDKNRDKEKILKDLEESKDMNPNGFWEMLYTVQGIQYRLGDVKRLDKLLAEEEKSICKIVSQGLANSDPRFFDKMIYMIRHPRQVAKSQERLKRQFPMDAENAPILLNGEETKFHTPEMYINVTSVAARWLKQNSDVSVLFVNFDDLIRDPKKELGRIQEFLGEGDFAKADHIIEPKLKRSTPEQIDNPFWEDAESIYDYFVKGDFEGVIEYMKDPSRSIYVENARLFCTRSNTPRVYNQCKICRKDATTRNNFRDAAQKNDIDWQNEPCIFECMGFDPDYQSLTIEQSIVNNFWKDEIDPVNIPKEKEAPKEAPETVQETSEVVESVRKDVVFNKKYLDLMLENIETFKSEFSDIPLEDWDEYLANKSCGSCRQKIMGVIRQDTDKLSKVFSEILGENVSLNFPGKIESPIVEEFNNTTDMQEFLKGLKSKGKQIQSATPSPNGKGGYLLVVM